MSKRFMRKAQRGFTLIELLVVVLVIGILAAIAVPQYFKVVEKGKFAETTQWLNALKGAQERYLARNGIYYSGTITSASFDANLGGMVHFTLGAVSTASNPPAYTLTITRNSPCPAVYGCYIVSYVAPPGVITCNDTGPCTSDLLPN
jgi:prepilin-type N-terminal cleavage/methylation domain-containing protein